MPARKETVDPVRHGYGLAVRFLDDRDIADVVDELLGNKAEPAEAMCGFLGRLHDALELRGWGAKAAVQLEFAGNVVDWGPKITKDGQRLRITFEADGIDPAELGLLWTAHADRCRATFRFGTRQMELGAAPLAQDLAELMGRHDAGEHNMTPDYACPACLAYAAEERLRAPGLEGAEGEAGDAAEEPLAEGEEPSGEGEEPPAEPVA